MIYTPNENIPSDLWDVMKIRFTEKRQLRVEKLAANRTHHLQLIMQDVHDSHNVSACLRSADAFGLSTCHIVQKLKRFEPSSVTRGAETWLKITKHQTIEDCAQALKNSGHQIYAAIPRDFAIPLSKIPVSKPIAVIFGNEKDGVDPSWESLIDGYFTIPMVGMVESLNISVSCGIVLHELSQKIKGFGLGELSEIETRDLLNYWITTQFSNWKLEYQARKMNSQN